MGFDSERGRGVERNIVAGGDGRMMGTDTAALLLLTEERARRAEADERAAAAEDLVAQLSREASELRSALARAQVAIATGNTGSGAEGEQQHDPYDDR